MANHKSALKAARQAEARKEDNKYYARSMRNALKKIR
ncbi:MAG: 30S ribosomal protein S20, partial [Bacteroidales bacterium]|nr:30S ribosomal protein S20 [Bacteroidales bacterium]